LDHLAHHSFPTRRSSDLNSTAVIYAIAEKFCTASLEDFCQFPEKYCNSLTLSNCSASQTILEVSIKFLFLKTLIFSNDCTLFKIDRKSTRLNSSHVKKSY